jgi:hypothetical protein
MKNCLYRNGLLLGDESQTTGIVDGTTKRYDATITDTGKQIFCIVTNPPAYDCTIGLVYVSAFQNIL